MLRPWKVSAATAASVLSGLLILAAGANAADGDFETAFNGTGKLIGTFGGAPIDTDEIWAEAVQPDGKLVVAGDLNANGMVARLNPNGSFDSSFGGGDGIAEFSSGSHSGPEIPRAIAIQPDGKIVVVGDVLLASTNPFVVARYDSLGNLDPSFDGPGTPGNGIFRILHGTNDGGSAVAINGNKIDFAGNFDFHSIVYQLNGSDGSLDTAGFGNPNGYLTFDFPGGGSGQSSINGLTIQTDGKIVAVGEPNGLAGMGVARITTAGALDSAGFNSGGGTPGLIVLPPPAPDVSGNARSALIDPSGEILVGGELLGPLNSNLQFPADPAIAAVTSAGALDGGFGSGGYAVLPLPGDFDTGFGIARQPDGNLLLGGGASDPHNQFLIARFTAGGVLDTSFASPAGYTSTDFGTAGAPAHAFALSPTGVAYVGGGVGNPGSTDDFAIAAYRAYTIPSSAPPDTTTPPATTSPQPSAPVAAPTGLRAAALKRCAKVKDPVRKKRCKKRARKLPV
jgi:uncharacterized delta-60 repeat protein